MKWPSCLTLIRHDVSAFNNLRAKKARSPLYQQFMTAWSADPASEETRALAGQVQSDFALGVGDANTPLADDTGALAIETGRELPRYIALPDVIFTSPYVRTQETLRFLKIGWPSLASVPTIIDDRVREQEHGLALLYNDWRVFHALHPDQRKLFEMEGPYWYRYPQGESAADTRARNREFLSMLIREFRRKKVLVITHHLHILAAIANLERLSPERFIEMDRDEKPRNCGVTIFKGDSTLGKNGRLVRAAYNLQLY